MLFIFFQFAFSTYIHNKKINANDFQRQNQSTMPDNLSQTETNLFVEEITISSEKADYQSSKQQVKLGNQSPASSEVPDDKSENTSNINIFKSLNTTDFADKKLLKSSEIPDDRPNNPSSLLDFKSQKSQDISPTQSDRPPTPQSTSNYELQTPLNDRPQTQSRVHESQIRANSIDQISSQFEISNDRSQIHPATDNLQPLARSGKNDGQAQSSSELPDETTTLETPSEGEARADEETPTAEVTLTTLETPTAEEATSNEETPTAEETTSAAEKTPTVEETSMTLETPTAEEATPTVEEISMTLETPTAEEATSAAEKTPTVEETSMTLETPTAEEATPTVEEISMTLETPTAEETASNEETSTVEETLEASSSEDCFHSLASHETPFSHASSQPDANSEQPESSSPTQPGTGDIRQTSPVSGSHDESRFTAVAASEHPSLADGGSEVARRKGPSVVIIAAITLSILAVAGVIIGFSVFACKRKKKDYSEDSDVNPILLMDLI